MGTRNDFNVNFGDSIYQYRDPGGREGVRNFHGRPKPFYDSGSPLVGAAAAPAGASGPLVVAAITAVTIVVVLVVGIPLAVIFGVVLPNATTDTVTPVPSTVPPVVPPVVPTQPGGGPNTVAPPVRTLLVQCPNDISRGTDTGLPTAVVNWNAPNVLSQTVGPVTMTPTVQPNQAFAIGRLKVDYVVTDAANNRGTCFFWITIVDDEPPAIQCPAPITVPTDQLSQSASVNFPLATVTENTNGAVTRLMTDDPGDQFIVGTHTVTIVVTDEAGNENRCSFTITVEDREDPRITCPNNLRANTNDPNGGAPATWPDPSVIDNVLATPQVTCTPASGSSFPYGMSSVNCTATDNAGNQGSCVFQVEIRFNDTEIPTFMNCPADFSVNATVDSNGATVTWVVPTATDNSQMSPTVTTDTNPNTFLPIGTHRVTYTATDADGNIATCMFDVEVVDIQDPTIMCPASFRQDTDMGRADAGVSLPAATTSDNSMMALTVSHEPPNPPTLGIGDNRVTYTVTDEGGNTASCNITVTIEDKEPPSITCQSLITVRAVEGQSYGNISFSPPAAMSDNSGGIVDVTTSPASNTRLVIGTHQVLYTATDPSGNSAMCNLTVNIVDFETPDLACPADVNTTTPSGMATTSVTFAATVIDNSGVITATSDIPTGSPFSIGMTVVTFTATDDSGNTVTCNFTITVRDEEDPTIVCPDHFSQNTDHGRPNATVTLPMATTSDNSMTMTVTTNPSGSPTLGIGTNHMVTYTVTDDSGNAASCVVMVSIYDMEPPSFTPPSNFEVRTDPGKPYATVSLPLPSNVMDNSGGEVTITTSPANNSMLAIGPKQVTYNATDPSGNVFMATITVTVVDMEPPDLECPADNITSTDPGEAFATVTITPRTLTDNDGNRPTLMSNASGNTFNIGSTVVTLTAQDVAENEDMCSFVITVQDTEDPLIMCPANFNQSTDDGQPNATVLIPAATTSDNSLTPVTAVSDPSGSVSLEIGSHTVTYTATDASGNTGTCNVTITIKDMEPPTWTPPSSFEVPTDPGEPFAIVSLPLPTDVMDNSGEEVTITTSPANNSRLDIGTTEVTYTATDPSGNWAMFSLNVTVIDNEDPVITCPANFSQSTDMGRADATVMLPDAMATDNSQAPLVNMTNPSGSPTLGIGSHSVMYTVTDQSGNSASCNITVTITDDEDPLIMCPANFNQSTDSGQPNATVLIPAATASDNSLTPVTAVSDPSGSVSLEIGSHTVTYTATDASGNTETCNVTIEIIDMEDPTLMPPSDFVVPTDPGKAYAIVSLPLPSDVMDNSGEEVTITTSPANNSRLDIGTTEVTYTATDPSGNSVMFGINVTVVDLEPPELVCPSENITATDPGKAFATVTFEPQTLTDNDGNMPTLTSDAPNNTFYVGQSVVTLTARDGAGNNNTCTFTITVKDTEPPVLECPSEVIVYSNNLTIPLAFSGVATWTVNVSDNSKLPLVRNSTTRESGTLFVGNVTVTHTAVDTYNNTAQCSFPVRVIGLYNVMCSSSVDLDLGELIGTGAVYHVMSPAYDKGDPYPPMSNCVVRVSAPAGSHIRMSFSTFETESERDILTVGSGLDDTAENTTLASFSGESIPRLDDGSIHIKDRVYGDSIWLRFESDDTFDSMLTGFLLQLDFIDNPRDLYPDSYSFCADFGGFPCLNGSCIDISQRCDGNNNDCSNNEDETDCPQACNSMLSEDVFFTLNGVSHINIVSNYYPGEYRPCNATWNIDSTDVASLRVVVMDIQIGTGDRLYVINRDTGDQVTPDIDSPISLHVTGGSNFAVVFKSGGEVGRGFWIRVWRHIGIGASAMVDFPASCELDLHGVQCGTGTCVAGGDRCNGNRDCTRFGNDEHLCDQSADCGSLAISLDGPGSTYHLTSLYYPAHYVINIDCLYIVTTTASKIHVSFRDLEISTKGLSADYLRIGNGATVNVGTIISVNNAFLPEDVKSSGNQIWIKFFSGVSVTARGFWIALVAE
ncbi:hyalin-like isoform X2 [Patiria miniata]|uniref:HYR domain-containing protein n=1 Tax=Patiria miniata TaxID=46514 RepID=A0A914A0N8_PATMI|nr:hyalin-like isoform X2 [Patiria miniata]